MKNHRINRFQVTGFLFGNVLVANARPPRMSVWGIGDDISPCIHTAPCEIFAGTLPKTVYGGEIHSLAPGLAIRTISKTMDFKDTYSFASNLTSRANGVSIDDTTYVDSSGTSRIMTTTPSRRVKILSSRPAEEPTGTGYLSRSCGGNC